MRRLLGQSLTEYGIVAALVAVVSVPALVLLSGNVNGLLQGMLGGGPNNSNTVALATSRTGSAAGAPDPVGSTRAANQDNGNGQGQTSDQPPSEYMPGATVTAGGSLDARYDRTTGRIYMPIPAANGGGTAKLSVDGNQATLQAALLLKNLSQDWEKSTGQKVPPDLAGLFAALGKQGERIAKAEQDYINRQAGTTDVHHATDGFTGIYMGLHNSGTVDKYRNNPQYSGLINLFDSYTGVISSVARQNFLERFPRTPEFTGTSSMLYSVGRQIDTHGLTQQQGQHATHTSSTRLGHMAGG